MKRIDFSKNLQVIVSYSLIVATIVMLIFALGFMTSFYELFVNGSSEMYEFFKDLQILNNAIFQATIICVIMALMLIPFDVTKKRVGIFSSIYTLIVAVVTFFNTQNVLRVNKYFADIHRGMDFSELTTYPESMFPFTFTKIIFITVTVLAGLTAVLTFFNIKAHSDEESE